MTEFLSPVLRLIGACLIVQSFAHIHLHRRLKWREEAARMSPFNAAVFHVHIFFVCLVLVMMGLPCIIQPAIFLRPTPAGAWIAWSFSAFWAVRLYFQWFVYKADLWRGKRMETAVHWWFTCIWIALSGVFAACGAVQAGWLR